MGGPQSFDWQPQQPSDANHTATTTSNHRDSALAHEGTMLFEHVRSQFRIGISALDNLVRFLEMNNARDCITKEYRKGIDELLDNLIAMARWLVSFLMSAAACHDGNSILPWAKSAIIGLRVELHQYSWKVMRITKMLAAGIR